MTEMKTPQPNSRLRIAVIGGGISGLSAAHRLIELAGDRVEVTLFEASPRLGGLVGTEEVAGYRLEHGADSFITDKPAALSLCQRLGLGERMISTNPDFRRSWVLRAGKPYVVPEGFQLLAPKLIWPILRSPLLSLSGRLRLLWEPFVQKRGDGGDESLASFARRRFGNEAFDRLIQPLVGGIYTADPEKLSMRATLERFARWEEEYGSVTRGLWAESRKKKVNEDSQGARYGLFMTPRGGIGELVSNLSDRVARSATILLNQRVGSLERSGPGWKLREADSSHVQPADSGSQAGTGFHAVILALNAQHAASLVGPHAPELALNLKKIEHASSAIVVTGHRLSEIESKLDAFGLVIPAQERRRILAVSFTSRKFIERAPEGCVQLRTFIGGAMQPEMMEHSDEELIRIALEELRDLLGVKGEPEVVRIARYMKAMPQYHIGHLDLVQGIKSHRLPGLQLAGNSLSGVGIPDCIAEAERAADSVLEFLNLVPKS